MRIRHADPDRDAAACAAIYAPYVQDGVASFEEKAPDAAAFGERIAELASRHPFLVADDGAGEIAGYAYGAPHRARPAYRWAADTSVYIAPDRRGQGVGRELYRALLDLLRAQGVWTVCAGITLPNVPSVALHESAGFKPVGVYRAIGWKAGAWRDVGWWQLALRDPAEAVGGEAPAELGPPARMR